MPAPYNLTDNPHPEGKHPGGRPLKYPNPEDLQIVIDKYLEDTPTEKLTITGLALACDFTRVELNDYAERGEYSNIVKKARQKVEQSYEQDMRKNACAGSIFVLKNMGWTDRQDIDVTDSRLIQAILSALPPQIAEKVQETIKLRIAEKNK